MHDALFALPLASAMQFRPCYVHTKSHLSNTILFVSKFKQYSLHEASSDPSVQSLFPSHIHANGMHSPLLLRHVKSSDEQTFVSECILRIRREMNFKNCVSEIYGTFFFFISVSAACLLCA